MRDLRLRIPSDDDLAIASGGVRVRAQGHSARATQPPRRKAQPWGRIEVAAHSFTELDPHLNRPDLAIEVAKRQHEGHVAEGPGGPWKRASAGGAARADLKAQRAL